MDETTRDDIDALLQDWDPRNPLLQWPFEIYRELRERCPVAHSDRYGGYHVVSRYEDVSEAASDWRRFTSAQGITMPPYGTSEPMIPLEMDPPAQGDYRRLMTRRLSARSVADLEGELERQARHILEPIRDRGHGDLVLEFAQIYPILAFWQEPLMGPPIEDSDLFEGDWLSAFRRWTHGMHHDEDSSAAVEQIEAYVDQLLADRRSHPRDDIPTLLLDAEIGGRRLTESELRNSLLLLFSAGIETTVASLGAILHHLGRHPDLRARLRDDPSLIEPAAEEFLRMLGPNQGVKRTATRDTEIGGCPVEEGEAVLLLWAAANRDPAAFDNPESFVADREPNPHLAFGKGAHKCIGMHFARLELQVALRCVLEILPDYEVTVPDSDLHWKVGIDRVLESLPIRATGVTDIPSFR